MATVTQTWSAVAEMPAEEAPSTLSDANRHALSQEDEHFRHHDWDELRTIIGMCDGGRREPRRDMC